MKAIVTLHCATIVHLRAEMSSVEGPFACKRAKASLEMIQASARAIGSFDLADPMLELLTDYPMCLCIIYHVPFENGLKF